jgi:hypothetical protein
MLLLTLEVVAFKFTKLLLARRQGSYVDASKLTLAVNVTVKTKKEGS